MEKKLRPISGRGDIVTQDKRMKKKPDKGGDSVSSMRWQ
jgi:hypothetical protein